MSTFGPFGFTGGMLYDPNTATYRVLPNDMYIDAVNVTLEGDMLVKRKGSASIGAHPGADDVTILGNYGYRSSGSFTNYIIGVSGGKVAYQTTTNSGASGSWTDISGALSMLSDRKGNTFTLNNIFVITNLKTTTLTPVKWTGTGNVADLGGTPPAGYCGCVAFNYAFLANDRGSNMSRVWWSNVGDPETWGAANYIDFRKDDGDQILAVIGMDDYLIIFKNRSMGKLWLGGSTFGPLTTISEKVGIADINGVDRLPDGRIIFIGGDSQAYIYDGSKLENISSKPYPKSSVDMSNIFLYATGSFITVRAYWGGLYKRSQVWFCLEDGSTRYIWIYDFDKDIWVSRYTQIKCFSVLLSDLGNWFYTGSSDGYVYLQDYSTTNNDRLSATTFDSSFTKAIHINPDNRKVYPVCAVMPFATVSFSGTFKYGFNQQSNSTTTNTYSIVLTGSSSSYRRKIIPIVSRGNTSQMNLIFSEDIIGHTWTMEPFFLSDEVIV